MWLTVHGSTSGSMIQPGAAFSIIFNVSFSLSNSNVNCSTSSFAFLRELFKYCKYNNKIHRTIIWHMNYSYYLTRFIVSISSDTAKIHSCFPISTFSINDDAMYWIASKEDNNYSIYTPMVMKEHQQYTLACFIITIISE